MDKELGITTESYPHRNMFFGFDLTTMGTPVGLCFESFETQNMEIVAHIREAKDFPIEMIVYAEYDAELEMQLGRKVVMQLGRKVVMQLGRKVVLHSNA